MNEPEQKPALLTEEVWPPAPLHVAIPPPLLVSAEGIEVAQSGGRLIVVNKLIRWLILLDICLFTIRIAPLLIMYWTEPFHHVIQLHLQTYLTFLGFYCLIELCSMGAVWCVFNFVLSLGSVALDKNTGTVRANGRLRPISKIEAVRVTRGAKTLFPTGFSLQLIWKDDDIPAETPRWKKVLKRVGSKKSFLGTFRREDNAEKIAAAVAEFTNVPVEHRTSGKNSV